jgi:membrane protease YdiL (CAAX protease family)
MSGEIDLKGVAVFVMLACTLAAGLGFVSPVLAMFAPLIAAFLTTKYVTGEDLRAFGIAKGSLAFYLWALAYPLIIIVLTSPFLFIPGLPREEPYLPLVFPSVPILVAAPFINFIPAFGEEYGWRGFLTSKLKDKYGILIAFIVTGVIWNFWHFFVYPTILLSGQIPPDLVSHAGSMVRSILISCYLGWLTVKSKSVFPAALCHGAINAYINMIIFVVPGTPLWFINLVIILPLLLVAAITYYDLRRGSSRLA